ncbi:adenosine deaminase [Candidatus Uhrbacteria bacterium CG10_big_fil_rev_8_21_14_0_10_48_11]|uniref:adenosine deaminase n=1 Tax=Candidatus Uhrbacteria bacterium CG10_big_fil_rev_8_21_14_0_10_48_11 TaxID=1975037 RepID=A0A2M8LDR8_9BACT|nr:MAG: adenosine deaminase [Candidatus Uhrbacteria bacterium CG10_big_fil_rev_8_21_14_0_10_48_11]
MANHTTINELQGMPLAELHSHVGGAVDAAVLWTLAHDQGIKLPTKNYWEFEKMVTVKRRYRSFKEIDRAKYHWTELIQSSPVAMEPAVHQTIGGAYRSHHIVLHEIRFNPMKRNRNGERDLDYIINASIRGLERAMLEYPEVRAGIILMLDREFTFHQNEIIYNKALKYKHRGIIGIDIAGPQAKEFKMKNYVDLFCDAKKKGLGVTVHTGEEGQRKEMAMVVKEIIPDRIGHGIKAHQDKALMRLLVEQGTVLEICPTSNLKVGVFKTVAELKKAYRTLFAAGVKLTINTDGPEMYETNLAKELEFLANNNVFTVDEIKKCTDNAFAATFIKERSS